MNHTRGYLLDTNVISEIRKSRPNPLVQEFLSQTRPARVFISVLTFGELRRGAEKPRSKDPAWADELHQWVDSIESTYESRILPVDLRIARIWGELTIARSRPIIDTLIAATAIAHELALVTRNVIDVREIPVRVINPWDR